MDSKQNVKKVYILVNSDGYLQYASFTHSTLDDLIKKEPDYWKGSAIFSIPIV